MLVLLGAMQEEIARIRQGMTLRDVVEDGDSRLFVGLYKGYDVALCQTGMGWRKAEEAARMALDRFPASSVVSFGIAGGLTESVAVGDVVLCSPLHAEDAASERSEGAPLFHSDDRMVSLTGCGLEAARLKWAQAASVSALAVVCRPDEKRRLGQACSAAVVDMESYWIARVAADRGAPFLAVRAVSDGVDDALPPLQRLVKLDGSLRRRAAAWYFVRHPHDLVRLLRLYRNASRATRNLAVAMDCVITRLATAA